MKVYHGSLDIVQCPAILKSNRSLDYGSGFYATTSYEQAESWVIRKMQQSNVKVGYVNVYEYEESKDLNILSFNEPTSKWAEFVRRNRKELAYKHEYDIVYGPVANDKVYAAFSLYESGILDVDTLIKTLKTYKLVDQFLYHTEKALQTIKFIEAKEVRL